MNSLVEAGLRLERFEEHPDLYWNQFEKIPSTLAARLPHTYSLLMSRPRLETGQGERPVP